jgi:nucleotide-binding universal stress UspA family protein
MPRAVVELSGRAILLATDGSPAANAAARAAYALAERHHAEIRVISVMDTRTAPMPASVALAMSIADATVGESVHAEQRETVRLAVEAAVGQPIDWAVRVALGTPARVITHEARRLRAALVIVGLRRHGRLGRALHDETALEVMRRAACPVLGVAADARGLPRKVLAAVDFSQSSLTAVRAARAVMADRGTIVLAYASPITFDLPDDGEAVIHELGVQAAFAKCRAELQGGGITVDQVVLRHEPSKRIASALLDRADQEGCDLMSAGSARRGRVERWLIGSVSTDLVRDGRRSMLVVPPRRLKGSATPGR